MWSALTSGINSGTCSCIRNDEAFEQTATPAAAQAGSASVATLVGKAEKASGTSATRDVG
ncbi:MAG: hypothetical protein NVS2B7_20250 [Herpetosiphon sp.]